MKLLRSLAIAYIAIAGATAQTSRVRPRFEVASLKSNPGCQNLPQPPGNFSPSPGRLELPCVTLQDFIRYAYGMFRDGITANLEPLHIEGGPRWLGSDYYSLSAKSDGFQPTEMLAGPILQTREERFQLKIHWEHREMPNYSMTLAKGGLKVKRLADGACTPLDLSHPPPPSAPGEPPPNLCGIMVAGTTTKGALTMELHGGTMIQLAQRLSPRVKRLVVDNTNESGRFTFHLEYAPDVPARAPDESNGVPPLTTDIGPNIFEALQEQIGVKLSPSKGPVDYLIVDGAERPTGN